MQAYEKRKAVNNDWDMGDWVAHLHQQLRLHPFPCDSRFHFIYIDEVR